MTEELIKSTLRTDEAKVAQLPEKITFAWLMHYVPLGMWGSALTVLGFIICLAFSAGVSISSSPVVLRELAPVLQYLGIRFPDINDNEAESLKKSLEAQKLEIATLKDQLLRSNFQPNNAMPLDGAWLFKTRYHLYFNRPDSVVDPTIYSSGQALFLWRGDKSGGKYNIILGGGVHNAVDSKIFATYVISFRLETDISGIPKVGCEMIGEYVSRTTTNREYESRGDQTVLLRAKDIKYADNNRVSSMIFFVTIMDHGKKTEGEVTFTRPPPV